MNKYDVLYQKIIARLNEKRIESTNEVVSAGDVRDAIYNAMSLYNVILSASTVNTTKNLNRSIGYGRLTFSKKRLPKVKEVINTIDENSDAFVCVYFEDGNKIVLTGDGLTANIFHTTFDSENTIAFVNANKEIFNIYLGCLKDFASMYPGIKMNFGQNVQNNYNQEINDGFLSTTININNPENAQVIFSSLEEQTLANEDSKKYSELYDYIAFYNEEVLYKIAINTNELNPFVKSCVESYLKIQEDTSFTLSK